MVEKADLPNVKSVHELFKVTDDTVIITDYDKNGDVHLELKKPFIKNGIVGTIYQEVEIIMSREASMQMAMKLSKTNGACRSFMKRWGLKKNERKN